MQESEPHYIRGLVTGVDPITIRQSFENRARYGRSLARMKLSGKVENERVY